MKPRRFKSSQEDQEEAFFGDHQSSSSAGGRNPPRRRNNTGVSPRDAARSDAAATATIVSIDGRSLSSYSKDEQFAMKLQRQYNTELNRDRQTAGDRSSINNENEQSDWELAQKLQNEQDNETHRTDRTTTVGDQEDEDAQLAKALQEALNEEHNQNEQQQSNDHNNNTRRRRRVAGIFDHHTINALIPKCTICNKIVHLPLHAMGNLYHKECFRCTACHGSIEPNESFAVTTGEDGQRHPLHRHCYADLYGLKCTVCQNSIQGDSSGRVSYIKHPFFEEIMCPSHGNNSAKQRKCTGCNRFEPQVSNTPFADLGDGNRCVCFSCCRTVIVDSNDAKPLWNQILRFFADGLNLPIFRGMEDIPILIVPHDALNSQLQNSNHQGSSQIMTRGLCLSEHQIGMNLMLPSLRFDKHQRSFLPSDAKSKGHTYFQIPDSNIANPQTNVTAILCLTGLPSDLAASILAHEATHAWFKLHPDFDPTKQMPPQVEEGCCQLIAMIFLTDGLDQVPSSSCNDSDGPSDEKLRQYFKFSIETDTNEIYGEGYRKAARAYAQIGLEALLSHVVTYCEFPNI